MKRFAGALLGIFAYASAAVAGPGDACAVAAHLVQADFALARVAAAIKNKSLTVVVEGTASSTLPGASGPAAAYPARLEAALQKKLPGVKVMLISLAKSRQTAADMAATFSKVLGDEKPQLVIWQTGTADAMRLVTAARRVYQKAGFELVHAERHHGFGHDLTSQTWRLALR